MYFMKSYYLEINNLSNRQNTCQLQMSNNNALAVNVNVIIQIRAFRS
ncbi:35090_t:CDS:2 [Gigaspora margarita]|uniref:35090_t:CDS:1 n=1 Tax=Gigaspora margarita TaxID=4874 RepID=A0ABM8VYT1_GIGMA|nr:35090_t:CDS:2 [Gigaspora margarita]